MKKKTTTSQLVNKITVNYIKAQQDKLSRDFAWGINNALFGEPPKDTRTIWQKRIDVFKGKISDIRVSIAEWIGGSELHKNCDY